MALTSYHTLSNGMRMVHIHAPRANVDFCGITVRAGSRDDSPSMHGLAHFVEHTIFKGTQRRSSWHIINRMEVVGGEINAYTTKEETVVYACAPRGNLNRAVELIADLANNSRFPENGLSKEREVVADEIDSYLDTPYEAVYDEFEDLLFAGTPLSHNILGNKSSLANFTSQACRNYLKNYYVPANMVAFYCGPVGATKTIDTFNRHWGAISGHDAPQRSVAEISQKKFDEDRTLSLHQSHTIMGNIIGSMNSPERYANALLTNIIGGPGMNSLLNVEMREHRGLVYTVDATASMLSDTGMLAIYFGCDSDDTSRCIDLVNQCIESIAAGDKITPRRLEMAKKQYLGQLAVAADNRENSTLATARMTLYHGQAATPAETRGHIQSLTTDDLQRAAQRLLPLNRLTLA